MAYPKLKTILIILSLACLGLVILGLVGALIGRSRSLAAENIKINGRTIKVELALRPADQYLGLSYRRSLCAACGMLFVFADRRSREFVMRGMNFPLDIIFISDHKIINIAANLPPEGDAPEELYGSAGPADAVLEVPGQSAAEWGVKVGDYVDY